jgi:hypothetical protein
VDALGKNYFVRIVSQHYRLYVSIAIGLTSALVSSEFGVKSEVTQAIVGYDVGTISQLSRSSSRPGRFSQISDQSSTWTELRNTEAWYWP